MHLKKEKKILKTIEVTKQEKKLTSPNGPALSSHAERTGTGPCFLRWQPVVDLQATKYRNGSEL